MSDESSGSIVSPKAKRKPQVDENSHPVFQGAPEVFSEEETREFAAESVPLIEIPETLKISGSDAAHLEAVSKKHSGVGVANAQYLTVSQNSLYCTLCYSDGNKKGWSSGTVAHLHNPKADAKKFRSHCKSELHQRSLKGRVEKQVSAEYRKGVENTLSLVRWGASHGMSFKQMHSLQQFLRLKLGANIAELHEATNTYAASRGAAEGIVESDSGCSDGEEVFSATDFDDLPVDDEEVASSMHATFLRWSRVN